MSVQEVGAALSPKRVKHFKVLSILFNGMLTLAVHIQKKTKKQANKCKKVINVMRCLVGTEWGADRKALKSLYTGLSVMNH